MTNTVEQSNTKIDDEVLDVVQGGWAKPRGPQSQAPAPTPGGFVSVEYHYEGGSIGGKNRGSGGGTATLSNGSTVKI